MMKSKVKCELDTGLRAQYLRFFFLKMCAIGLALFFSAADQSFAQVKIKFIVNGQVITSYDLTQRKNLMRLTGVRGNLTKRASDELIDEALKFQEAQRLGATPNEKLVDIAVANLARSVRLSTSALTRELARQGVNIETLRTRIRVQNMWGEIIRSRFNATVKVLEQDVTAALIAAGKVETELTTVEYDLHQIVFVIPSKSSAGYKSKRKRAALNLQRKFSSCQEGLQGARKLSDVVVKRYGLRSETDLPPKYRSKIEKTKEGHLAGPFSATLGIEMLAVCAKREIKSAETARKQIKTQLSNEEGSILARRYLREIRRQASIEHR